MRLHRLVAVPVALATWPALAAGGVASGAGALQASASIDLRIDVPKVLEIHLQGQPRTIEVTAADAASGEMVVTGPRVEMVSNDRRGYWVDASLRGPFAAATVEGLPAPMKVDGSGGRALMPSMVGQSRPRPYTVRYRLRLREGTVPGSYAWPVALSIDSP